MATKIINNPNTPSSIMSNSLTSLSDQRDKYSQYDNNVPNFKPDSQNGTSSIETFMTFDKFMFDKLLIIIIIGLLAVFIIKGMDLM
jgi:hypothetical protein